MNFNLKNIFFLSLLLFTGILIFLFEPIIFGGKMFGSPDSLSPRSVGMALNNASKEIGGYPHWQPWIFSGMPTAESFSYLSKLYFPEYIFKIFSLPGSIIQLLHLVFAGLGCMQLFRYFKCSSASALLGSVAFMVTPFMITMAVFGHGSQLMTAAYIPWAILFTIKLWETPNLINCGLLALTLGFQLQRAHAQIAYYTWLMVGFYFLVMIVYEIKNSYDPKTLLSRFTIALIACALGIGISLLIYLPAMDYTPFSVRGGSSSGGSDYSYATGWSFHPIEMLTFLIPSAFGFGGPLYWGYMPFTDYPNYMGIIILLLAIIGIINKKGIIKWYLITASLLALFISFGRHFSLVYDIFFNLFPYFDKFRVPHMILILVQFNVAIFAAFGMDFILKTKEIKMPKWFLSMIVPFALFFVVLIFGGNNLERFVSSYFAAPRTSDPAQIQMINAMRWDLWTKDAWTMLFFSGSFFVLCWLVFQSKITSKVFASAVIGLAIFDLLVVDNKIINPDRSSGRGSQLISKRFVREFYRPDPIVNYLAEDKSDFRIYPAGQLFGESRFAAFGLESIGGYHPAKLKVYNDLLINTQNAGVFPVLKMLNAKYLLVPDAQQIAHPELSLVKKGSLRLSRGEMPTAVYRLDNYLPRAWFIKDLKVAKKENIWQKITDPSFDPRDEAFIYDPIDFKVNTLGKITSFVKSIHKISLSTESTEDQFLVLSEIFYPKKWIAYVDGNPVTTLQVNGLLRGVRIPKGSHTVEFIYDKTSFNRGLLISILCTLFSLGLIAIGLKRQTKNEVFQSN